MIDGPMALRYGNTFVTDAVSFAQNMTLLFLTGIR